MDPSKEHPHDFIEKGRKYNEVKKQRDKLLEALQAMYDTYPARAANSTIEKRKRAVELTEKAINNCN